MSDTIHTITIEMHDRDVVIEYTDVLLEQIRIRYGMSPLDPIDENLIKLFLTQELQSALNKVMS